MKTIFEPKDGERIVVFIDGNIFMYDSKPVVAVGMNEEVNKPRSSDEVVHRTVAALQADFEVYTIKAGIRSIGVCFTQKKGVQGEYACIIENDGQYAILLPDCWQIDGEDVGTRIE